MKHRRLSLAIAGTGVACTLVAIQAPAAAKSGPKKKDLTEEGCRDITYGSGNYARDLLQVLQDSGTLNVGILLGDKEVYGGNVPSCSAVTYALTVYPTQVSEDGQTYVFDDANPLVLPETTAKWGDDSTEAVEWNDVQISGYSGNCVLPVVTTSVQGVVVDTAPDVGTWHEGAICHGDSPGMTYK